MAEISKVSIAGTQYDLKDAQARAEIAALQSAVLQGLAFIGHVLDGASITDGGAQVAYIKTGTNTAVAYYTGTQPTGNTYGFGGVTYTLTYKQLRSGDIIVAGTKEFMFSDADNKWHEYGSTGSLKALAFKDSASGTIKPKGTVASTFTGTAATLSHSVTQGTVAASGSFTPAGTVTQGSVSKEGVVKSYPGVTSKLATTQVTGVASNTTVASKASATSVKGMKAEVSGELLTLTASEVTFSDVTVPVKAASATTVATGSVAANGGGSSVLTGLGTASTVDAVTAVGNPTFAGAQGNVSVSGTTSGVAVASHSHTPSGSVASTFSGTQETVTVS